MAEVQQLYTRAEEAFQKRNYDYARDLFSQILLLDPNHEQTRKALRATIVTKIKEKGAPGKLKLMTMKGKVKAELAMARSDLKKKTDICQKYLLNDPNNDNVRQHLAEALAGLGHIVGATIEAQMALETNPKNVEAAKILVTGYKQQGKIKEAQDALEKVVRFAGEDRDISRLQRELAAIATTNKGFIDAAEGKDGYRDIMKDKGSAEQLERRQHMIKSKEDAEQFITDLEVEFEKSNDYKIARRIGDTYLSDFMKNPGKAKEWFQKAVEINPHDSTLKDRVEDCGIRMYDIKIEQAKQNNDPQLAELKKKRLQIFIQAYERRANDRPTDMLVQFELGRAYFTAGKNFLDKAIRAFQLAVKDPKRKIDGQFFLGRAFQKKGHHDMADQRFAAALEGGVMGQEKKLLITYTRAINLGEGGNFDQAIILGKEIMSVDIGYKDISALVDQWSAKVPK